MSTRTAASKLYVEVQRERLKREAAARRLAAELRIAASVEHDS